MKICSKCKKTKEFSDFHKDARRKDGLLCYCKVCAKELALAQYNKNKSKYAGRNAERLRKKTTENKAKMLEYLKDKGCSDCPITDVRVLDFDHIENKRYGISEMLSRYHTWETILKEIAKCEVRCANCHRIKTCEQFNWYKQ